MSRRQNDAPTCDGGTCELMPPMAELSLVTQGPEISAKRKAAVPPEKPPAGELPERPPVEELRITGERAVKLLRSLNKLINGGNLVQLEYQTTILLESQPTLFETKQADIDKRTREFEEVVNSFLDQSLVACPEGSSCMRLLQSIKAPYFAVAHQPFSEELPSDGEFGIVKREIEDVRNELKDAVSSLVASVDGEPADAETLTMDKKLEEFENDVGRVLLFGNVLSVPFKERSSLVDFWDEETEADTVSRAAMDVLKMHMGMLFYMTKNGLGEAVPTEYKKVMDEGPVVPKEEVEAALIEHILDDMNSLTIDKNNSMLAKKYWQMLRLLFDTTVSEEDGKFALNKEGSRLRNTQPGQEDIDAFKRAKEKYEGKSPEKLTPEDEYNVKVAYIELFMRIAMFREWSWFANSAVNLFSFDAACFRKTIAQTASGRKVAHAQNAFVQKCLEQMREESGELPPDVQAALTEAGVNYAEPEGTSGSTSESSFSLKAVSAISAPAGGGQSTGATGRTTKPAERLSTIVLNSVEEAPPQPQNTRVLRPRRGKTTQGVAAAPSQNRSVLPRATSVTSASESRYIAISKENKKLQKSIDALQTKVQELNSKVESSLEEARAANDQAGQLQEELDAANSINKEAEETQEELRKQLERLKREASRTSSSSSSEGNNPASKAVGDMFKRMESIEAHTSTMTQQLQGVLGGSTSRGARGLVNQLQPIQGAIVNVQKELQAVKETCAKLQKGELDAQLGELGSVSRMTKRYHRKTDDVLAWVYGGYKSGKVLWFLVNLLVDNRNTNGEIVLSEMVKLGMFGFFSYLMVEISEYILSDETSDVVKKWMSKNVDIRSFVFLYQAVTHYTYLNNNGGLLPLRLERLLAPLSLIGSAWSWAVEPFSLGWADNLWLVGGLMAGINSAKHLVVTLLIGAGATGLAFIVGPTKLIELPSKMYESIPTAPVVGQTVVKLGLPVLEGLQIFYAYVLWPRIASFSGRTVEQLQGSTIGRIFNALGIARKLATQAIEVMMENPKITLAMFAFAFALAHAAKVYQLDKKAYSFVETQLAKRARFLGRTPASDDGVKRLENLSLQQAIPLIREMAETPEGDTGGTDGADMEMASDTGSEMRVDARVFSKLAGTRIEDEVWGTFVILKEPHNNPRVNVAACAALMHQTDLHGLDR